jgi:hypothetical protein
MDLECFVVYSVDFGEFMAVSDVASFIHRCAQTSRTVVLSVFPPPSTSFCTWDAPPGVNGRGTFPMGLTTIVSMLCYVAIPKWGDPMLLFTEILFWINTALSFLICFGVLTLMFPPPEVQLR